jgi:phospholipase/carboxylesterase
VTELDGPRLAPASGDKPEQLVIFCHGFGADGNDLIALGSALQPLLPEAAFVSPHAPEPCAMAPMGRQWFPITRMDPQEYWRGCQAAGPSLDNFIDQEMARSEVPDNRTALVGFSQGTMMALYVALRRARPLAGVVGYSGALAGPEHLAGEIKARPPMLLVHGKQDDVVPAAALPAEALADNDVSVEWHLSDNLGHGIDQKGLELGGQFLAKVLYA